MSTRAAWWVLQCLSALHGFFACAACNAFKGLAKATAQDWQSPLHCLTPAASKVWLRILLCVLGHTEGVTGVCIGSEGKLLVSWSPDRTARVWGLQTGACLAILLHKAPVERVILAPYGSLIASTTEEGLIHLWDPSTGERLRQLQARNHSCLLLHLSLCPLSASKPPIVSYVACFDAAHVVLSWPLAI